MLAALVSLAALAATVTIPQLQLLIGTTSLSAGNWAIAIALALPALVIPLLENALRKVFK